MMSRGFPNCFFMGGMQSAVTPNFMELYNEQSRHLAYIIQEGIKGGLSSLEPSQQAETDWVRTITQGADSRASFQTDCTPGYYNNEGKPGEGPGWFGGNYAGGAQQFFELLADWRAKGDLAGIETG